MRHARVAAAVAVLALAGCGGPLVLRFTSGEKLNQREDKTPPENIPVDVRVFLLKDKAAFMNASVEQLWKKEQFKAVLGSDLVGEHREIQIMASAPGAAPKPLDLGVIPTEVRFIGIMAMISKKTDPPSIRHMAVPKEEADDYLFNLVDYKIEAKK